MCVRNESTPWTKPEVRSRLVHTTRGPVDLLEAGEGLPILYSHGTGAGSDIVPAMEHSLVAEGFRLIIPNRPGY